MPGSSERDRQHEVMRLLEEAGRVSVPDEEVLAWKDVGVAVQRVPVERT